MRREPRSAAETAASSVMGRRCPAAETAASTVTPCSHGHVGRRAGSGFTIIELIVVIGIILVLAGLILATSGYVHNKGARSRAEAEMAAISAALENYKADNGGYAAATGVDAKAAIDFAAYQGASLTLYESLTGDFNHDRATDPGKTSYMSFEPNQLSPADHSAQVAYIKDPFGNSYGYSTINQTDPSKGYNPSFDLWSTAGAVTGSDASKWIKNW